tara:strand:- start:507 stop:1718 length:1212 start_codon:yes stop_codon:yes gene_type:complete
MFPTRRIITSSGDKFRDEFSLAFDGTNDYIATGGKPVDTADATYVFWTKSSVSGSSNRAIFAHGNDRVGEFSLAYDSGGKALLYLHSSLYQYWDDGAGNSHVSDGKWHHVAVVVDIDSMPDCKLYIDGVEMPQGARSTSATATAYGNMEIGRANSTTEFEGSISELAVYDKHLSISEVKTLYNGREPYNHKEGVCSSNLQAWWRMGDGVFDGFPIVQDQTNTNIGSNLVSNPTFDTNTTGWEQYAGGSGDDNTISRETSIVHSGSGSLKITHAAGNNGYGAKLVGNPLTGTANKLMIIEGYVYIPSGSYSGGNPILTDGGAFSSASSHSRIEADASITNQWQYVRTVQILDSDVTGTIFLFTTGDDPSAGDILYWDDISVRMLEGNAGQMYNMDADTFKGDTP